MELAFILKKTLTLLALVDPFLAVPLFLAASAHLPLAARVQFARTLALTVAVGLLGGGLLGLHVLSLMGVTLAAMQLAGGVIVFVMALAMVVAKEQAIKLNAHETSAASQVVSLVPLGVPLLVGPGALAYVMATSTVQGWGDVLNVAAPPLVVALVTWLVLEVASRTNRLLSAQVLSLLERLGGFLLAAIAVEMAVAGLIGLFPALGAARG